MKWDEKVGPEENTDMNNGSCCKYLTERDHLEDLDKDGINNKRGLKEEGWKGINLLAPELFFLILAHPVYKM